MILIYLPGGIRGLMSVPIHPYNESGPLQSAHRAVMIFSNCR
jgi:hypothetical protein